MEERSKEQGAIKLNRKYQERLPRLINIEKSVYDEMQELLPKGVSLSDEINAYVRDRLKNPDREDEFSIADKEALR